MCVFLQDREKEYKKRLKCLKTLFLPKLWYCYVVIKVCVCSTLRTNKKNYYCNAFNVMSLSLLLTSFIITFMSQYNMCVLFLNFWFLLIQIMSCNFFFFPFSFLSINFVSIPSKPFATLFYPCIAPENLFLQFLAALFNSFVAQY